MCSIWLFFSPLLMGSFTLLQVTRSVVVRTVRKTISATVRKCKTDLRYEQAVGLARRGETAAGGRRGGSLLVALRRFPRGGFHLHGAGELASDDLLAGTDADADRATEWRDFGDFDAGPGGEPEPGKVA